MKNFKNFITENQLINEIGETSAGLEKLQKLNKRLYDRATFYNKRIGKGLHNHRLIQSPQ